MIERNFDPTVDDFAVIPQVDNTDFFQIFAALQKGATELGKWKEVKSRLNQSEEMSILVETALELSSTGRQAGLFRKRDDSNELLTAIWLGNVLKRAKSASLQDELPAFKGIDVEALREIAKRSTLTNSPRTIGEFLRKRYGIILICARGFAGMKVDGVATRLNSDHPVIGLSLRYGRYDNFWFTLMHELAHVALHYELLTTAICDNVEEAPDSDIEREANRVAIDAIVPRWTLQKSNVLRSRDPADLVALAERAEVHPALAAGIVRNKLDNYSLFSDLVNSIDVREVLGVSQ